MRIIGIHQLPFVLSEAALRQDAIDWLLSLNLQSTRVNDKPASGDAAELGLIPNRD